MFRCVFIERCVGMVVVSKRVLSSFFLLLRQPVGRSGRLSLFLYADSVQVSVWVKDFERACHKYIVSVLSR